MPGVHAMGDAGGKSVTSGVKVEVGEVQTTVDLELVVEYGVSIIKVAGDVRENVIAAIERMTGNNQNGGSSNRSPEPKRARSARWVWPRLACSPG